MKKRPAKFLLVDDLEGNLLVLEGLLRREGLELWKARSGPEALELLLVHDFALALIDVQMPGMDGFELAELMRGTERTRRVPIIFITAGAVDTHRRFRGYETGAVDFLFKPIEPHILQSKAEVFIELYQQREELRAAADENARLLNESRRAEQELRSMRDQLTEVNAELEKRVEERTARLRETVGELEYFSYTITHDMRAPLRAMQAFGTLLMEEKADRLDAEGEDFLRRIVDSAKRMDHLITDALNYSKVVRQQMQLQRVDAAALLRGILDSYPEFQPPRVQIELAGELPAVWANPAGLTQCFSNLLGNAVKFVPPGAVPRVKVWAERLADKGRIRIWLEDNGIGIPRDQHQRIFQMFQRLDRTQEGTGIGLALVRKVVEQMRGSVGVESEPGQGSRFWLELLPAAAAPSVLLTSTAGSSASE